MKRLFYSLVIAALALLPVACEKEAVPNTGDVTGTLYGTWRLDSKTVDYSSNLSGKIEETHEITDFTGEVFLLRLTDFYVAFGQEGSIFTFDIDDVDGVEYTYNADSRQISFKKTIYLSSGFFAPKIMSLSGTYDVTELTETNLTLKQTNSVVINDINGSKTTTYCYHRISVEPEETDK